jgi:hypothetical protein
MKRSVVTGLDIRPPLVNIGFINIGLSTMQTCHDFRPTAERRMNFLASKGNTSWLVDMGHALFSGYILSTIAIT